MIVALDLTEEQRAALTPLFAKAGSAVLASIHPHRPFKSDMPPEKIGAPVLICGTVPASALPTLRKLIQKEQQRARAGRDILPP